ncbi:DUF1343 domain-containing protein [Kiritimatiellaeota bacterium B1221]|nr:DUF1343 domain-containing protein [Kiritimatiellaeota bacterium B1221]
MSGLDRLLREKKLPFPGARAGILAHHASVNLQGRHIVDSLQERKEWQIQKLFSPEHGFFGKAAAGEKVQNSLHPLWKLPVHSLYGEHRSPPPEWLENLDVLVVDLQDLGVRCYTYASSLLLMMRACASASLPILVIERPTPLAGISDGPPLHPNQESFVGMIDLPLVFGLGQGDLAEFLYHHHSELRNLRLHVFRDPEARTDPTKWIPPSPAIVSPASARLYPVTVWCEAIADIDVDRGKANSFAVWCMPDFPEALLEAPPTFKGMTATPVSGEKSGLKFQIENLSAYRPVENALILLCALRDHLGSARLFDPSKNRPEFFDKLMGTSSVREQITAGLTAEEIAQSW